MADDERPWTPEPIPAETFTASEGQTNINRAPHDRVSGVVYKRAMATKRVSYTPLDPVPEMPAPWQGTGTSIVRWLFSEAPGTEEGLLVGRTFRLLQDIELLPGATTGQTAHPDRDTLIYVIEGEGMLTHHPSPGSPLLARPLRPGDAALIAGDEHYSLTNLHTDVSLRLILVGLTPPQLTGPGKELP